MNKNNKYYFFINSLELGGAERVTINFSNKMIKEGKEVYLITLKSKTFYSISKGVKHIKLSKIKNNFLVFLLIPRYLIKFKKILRRYRLKDGMSLLEISNFIHILSKKNAVISFRTNILFFKGFIGRIYKILIKLLYPRAKKIIVNSEENRYDLAEYLNIKLDKIDFLYNPIDKKEINKLKLETISEELNKKIKGKRIFITVARLIKSKNYDKIIFGLKSLYSSGYEERTYLIVGEGPEKNNLERLIVNLGLQNNIIFLGRQKNIFKYLNISDVFLYASDVEGFPNVLLEAKEIGLPIITSDFKSGAREVILGEYNKNLVIKKYPYYGRNGILVDIDNFKEEILVILKRLIKLKKL